MGKSVGRFYVELSFLVAAFTWLPVSYELKKMIASQVLYISLMGAILILTLMGSRYEKDKWIFILPLLMVLSNGFLYYFTDTGSIGLLVGLGINFLITIFAVKAIYPSGYIFD